MRVTNMSVTVARSAMSVLILSAGLAVAPSCFAQEDQAPPAAEAGQLVPAYGFGSLRLEYDRVHPEVPLIESLATLPVQIDTTAETIDFASTAAGVTLGQVLSLSNRQITVSAINEISRVIVSELNRQGIVGVLVAPEPTQIDPSTATDLRQDTATLRIKIYIGVVTGVRTVGTGERFGDGQLVDSPAHRRIASLSPARPWSEGDRGKRRDLIRADVLDSYVHRLNRHPARRVDLAVAAATGQREVPNAVTLDYLVRESKPWIAYAQISNTGTDSTNEWRERFGFVHNQVTGRDDIFQADFVTSSFEDSYAGILSYEAPLIGTDLVRAKVYGNWSDYTARDIGLPGQDLEGTTWTVGGELIANVYQKKSYFVDTFAGIRHESIEVTNDVAASNADTDFLIGSLGVRSEQRVPTRSIYSEVAFDYTLNGGDSSEIAGLGRLRAEDQWMLFRWDAGASFFIEPLINPGGWKEEGTFGSSLAHEIAVGFRGQHSFDDRLIPQQQMVAGGMHTVRGYPQSAVAGDTAVIATAEYRLHIPQLMGTSSEAGTLFGEPFRFKPDRAYGMADWDLVLAGFVDYGQTYINDADSIEEDESLLGAGIGIGFEYRRNLRIRADWGMALSDTENGVVESGDTEFHIVATLAF
jgi:hemolysin activation/secretion protein